MSNQNGFDSDEQEAYEYARWQERQRKAEPDVVPCFECGNAMYANSGDPQANICDGCNKEIQASHMTPLPERIEELLNKYVSSYSMEALDFRQSGQQVVKEAILKEINTQKIEELKLLLKQSEVVRVDGAVQSYGLFNAAISDRIKQLESQLTEGKELESK